MNIDEWNRYSFVATLVNNFYENRSLKNSGHFHSEENACYFVDNRNNIIVKSYKYHLKSNVLLIDMRLEHSFVIDHTSTGIINFKGITKESSFNYSYSSIFGSVFITYRPLYGEIYKWRRDGKASPIENYIKNKIKLYRKLSEAHSALNAYDFLKTYSNIWI